MKKAKKMEGIYTSHDIQFFITIETDIIFMGGEKFDVKVGTEKAIYAIFFMTETMQIKNVFHVTPISGILKSVIANAIIDFLILNAE